MNFNEAAFVNNIYQGNGLICQQKMCSSITGCDSRDRCVSRPEWGNIIKFCGEIGTPAMAIDGAYWRLQPVNHRQQLLSATQEATGFAVLPNPWNVTGMY